MICFLNGAICKEASTPIGNGVKSALEKVITASSPVSSRHHRDVPCTLKT